jgi:hypothetical protein
MEVVSMRSTTGESPFLAIRRREGEKADRRLLNINALNLGSGNAGNGGDASSGNAFGGDAGCHD